MAKPKNKFPSIRLRLDPWIRMRAEGVTENPRHQVLYNWYMENADNRKAATFAVEMLTAMLNGEMGPQMQAAAKVGDTKAAIEWAQDLIGEFVVEAE